MGMVKNINLFFISLYFVVVTSCGREVSSVSTHTDLSSVTDHQPEKLPEIAVAPLPSVPMATPLHEPLEISSLYPPSGGYGGGGGRRLSKRHALNNHWMLHWNEMAINASGIDHSPPLFGLLATHEQFGPLRAARAMAIVHIAIFEAVNAVMGGYESYIDLERRPQASVRAALAQAAHDTLSALFPSQASSFAAELAIDLSEIDDGFSKQEGIELGALAAQKILSLRQNDGSAHAEPLLGIDFFTSDDPGKWRQDPISLFPVALGAHWNTVEPFVIESASQFRAPTPPALDSLAYTIAYEEAKRLGGDGIVTPTERTPEQTEIGTYWAYDGTPSLCAPPRLYNQIATQLASDRGLNFMELARLLALLNVAMADAGIAVWESKYFYQFWRPITAIRESDVGTGPSFLGDGNPDTVGDINFSPLGAPASNLNGPNFTPPFPAYPSGHAGFGGAVFQMMRKFFDRDDISFTFVSDEFNGITRDNQGNIRPLKPRSFSSLSQAEEENGQSRIYLGIHWVFDKTEGIAQGRHVADYIFDRLFVPIEGK
jgi:hypothetical protein